MLPDVRKTPFPPLYAITDDRSSRTPAEQVRYLGDLGFPLVQLRCKRLSSEQFQGQIQQALEELRAAGHWPRVCLNDRIDLLKKIPAGLQPWGLHLGQEDTPVSEALALATPGLRLDSVPISKRIGDIFRKRCTTWGLVRFTSHDQSHHHGLPWDGTDFEKLSKSSDQGRNPSLPSVGFIFKISKGLMGRGPIVSQ